MTDGERCGDCPNGIDRRKADTEFREKIISQLSTLQGSVKIIHDGTYQNEKSVWDAVSDIRADIKKLYFRLGLIAGSGGAVGGIITALVVNAIAKG